MQVHYAKYDCTATIDDIVCVTCLNWTYRDLNSGDYVIVDLENYGRDNALKTITFYRRFRSPRTYEDWYDPYLSGPFVPVFVHHHHCGRQT